MVRGFVQGSICCPGVCGGGGVPVRGGDSFYSFLRPHAEESVNESPAGACFCRCDFYLEGNYGLSK